MKLKVEKSPVSFWRQRLTRRRARVSASCVHVYAAAQDIAGAKVEHRALGDSGMIRSRLFHVLTHSVRLRARRAGES
jgi:hypothetical protein